MKEKFLVLVPDNQTADRLQRNISSLFRWNEAGIVSYNVPLVNSLTVCENIMLPLVYSDKMRLNRAESLVIGILRKFKLEDAAYYKQKKLNSYDILIVKFLRAIMRCPRHIFFVMPHAMVQSEDYANFALFVDAIKDFNVIVIEHQNFAGEYLETKFTETSYKQWETLVLETLK